MAFGADDMQTARSQYRIVTNLPVGFDLRNLFRSRVFQLGDLGLPATAKHNVGTTAGHVGCNGYRRRIARLRNDIRSLAWNFAFSTLCLMPAFVNSLETTSDFSIEMVPTSTG
ncbi:Uncharacterised protein [Klebsiella michiganensis]|nr:Uncharacterised protein [Klebsiella michiganensis]